MNTEVKTLADVSPTVARIYGTLGLRDCNERRGGGAA